MKSLFCLSLLLAGCATQVPAPVQVGSSLLEENLQEAAADQSRIIGEYTRLLKQAYTDHAFERAKNLAKENGHSPAALERIMADLQLKLAENDATLSAKAQEFLQASSLPAAKELNGAIRRYLGQLGNGEQEFDTFLQNVRLILTRNQPNTESRPWILMP